MTWSIAIALLLGGAEPENGWQFGPWVEHRFETRLIGRGDVGAPVTVFLPRPQDGPAQRIDKIKGLPRGTMANERLGSDRDHRWVVYSANVSTEKPLSVGYSAIIQLRTRKIRENWTPTDKKPTTAVERRALQRYLTLGPTTGIHREDLRRIALALATSEEDRAPLAVARRMYDAVQDRFTFDATGPSVSGAGTAWDNRRGQCSDYVAAFVCLCRHANVPARPAAGYVLEKKGWDMHVWAEFHVAGLGWVPCDPAHGDYGPEVADAHFGREDGRRIVLTHDFDLDLELPPTNDKALVQQYLYTFRGVDRMTFDWNVAGGRVREPSVPIDPAKGRP